MGSLSIWHWMVVLLVVLLLFGSGKVSNLMGDFAKGIKAFKKNMADDESMEATAERPSTSIAAPSATVPPVREPVRETTPVHETTTVRQG
jgi:sec-independent protein translocase protein TatA